MHQILNPVSSQKITINYIKQNNVLKYYLMTLKSFSLCYFDGTLDLIINNNNKTKLYKATHKL